MKLNYGLVSMLYVPNNLFDTVEFLFSTHLGKENIMYMYHPFSTHLVTVHCSYHRTKLGICLT